MMMPHILAMFPDLTPLIGVMIPIVVLMIPIVAILTKHQQKMAEILHGNNQSSEILELRREVAELKSIVHQQAFAMDRLQSNQRSAKLNDQISISTN